MSDVVLSDVRKSFGAVNVIKGVDLDIKSGEFVVFVGPSGCGTSVPGLVPLALDATGRASRRAILGFSSLLLGHLGIEHPSRSPPGFGRS